MARFVCMGGQNVLCAQTVRLLDGGLLGGLLLIRVEEVVGLRLPSTALLPLGESAGRRGRPRLDRLLRDGRLGLHRRRRRLFGRRCLLCRRGSLLRRGLMARRSWRTCEAVSGRTQGCRVKSLRSIGPPAPPSSPGPSSLAPSSLAWLACRTEWTVGEEGKCGCAEHARSQHKMKMMCSYFSWHSFFFRNDYTCNETLRSQCRNRS